MPGTCANLSFSCYASLGALGDFSDRLIAFSYERQAVCDPVEGPYYFDCLQELATGRGSDMLITKSATLASENVLGRNVWFERTSRMFPEADT
jgi:ubiquitin carboxyl-terminal hydrolase 25/28